jgi:hypothetical protein
MPRVTDQAPPSDLVDDRDLSVASAETSARTRRRRSLDGPINSPTSITIAIFLTIVSVLLLATEGIGPDFREPQPAAERSEPAQENVRFIRTPESPAQRTRGPASSTAVPSRVTPAAPVAADTSSGPPPAPAPGGAPAPAPASAPAARTGAGAPTVYLGPMSNYKSGSCVPVPPLGCELHAPETRSPFVQRKLTDQQKDSALHELMSSVPAKAGPPQLQGIQVPLPGGGPSAASRRRDSIQNAEYQEILARIKTRADSVRRERVKDSLRRDSVTRAAHATTTRDTVGSSPP